MTPSASRDIARILFGAAIASLLACGSARASIEDFESWDVGAQEGDDEYGLDAYFLSFSPEWETEWLFAEEGARSGMGSTVNEVWEMRNDIRIRNDLSPHLRFAYEYVQNQGLTIDDQQHTLGLEVERGGFWFGPFARPNSNKEHLDAGLFVRKQWRPGTDLQLSLSFEDWNSDHTNGRSGIRDRTSVDFIDPAREWRVSGQHIWSERRWLTLDASWLPEFRRNVTPSPSSGETGFLRTTGGHHELLRALLDPLPDVSVVLDAEHKRSRVADFPDDASPAVDTRREARRLRARVTHPVAHGFLGRWGLQARNDDEWDAAAPPGGYRLELDDIVATVGTRRQVVRWLTGEFGFGHQTTHVHQRGPRDTQRFSWGTRTENRLYLVAEFQTAGLRFRLIETIELDDEGYPSFSDHDKGFVQFQAVF